MDLDVNCIQILNAYDSQDNVNSDLFDLVQHANEVAPDLVYVALGESASICLKQEFNKVHFKLPHPSGLNRKLNDKQEISRLLYRCKKYIYE